MLADEPYGDSQRSLDETGERAADFICVLPRYVEGRALKAYLLTVAYHGAEFCGWQYQPNQRSVQETLESGLLKVLGKPVRALASSRTDAGVHAIGQAVVIRTDAWSATPDKLPFATNIHLPETVVVRQAVEVPSTFHPLRHCTGKRYQYRVYNSRKGDPLGTSMHWWVRRQLSLEKMQAAAEQLIGTHDFLSFQSAGSPRTSTIRTIRSLTIEISPHLDGQLLSVTIEADGFLYNMVRNIVGTLVQVGVGRESPHWITGVLEARDRQQAGATAPAHGLTLIEVMFLPAAKLPTSGPQPQVSRRSHSDTFLPSNPSPLCE